MSSDLQPRRQNSTSLVDVLDRVLDKGLVVAGDIKVSVAEVELLTIRVRLVVCSIDKAQEIGLDWWRRDPYLSGRFDKALPPGESSAAERLLEPDGVERRALESTLLEENRRLREELDALRERSSGATRGKASPRRKAAGTTTTVAKNKPTKGAAKPRATSSVPAKRRKSRQD